MKKMLTLAAALALVASAFAATDTTTPPADDANKGAETGTPGSGEPPVAVDGENKDAAEGEKKPNEPVVDAAAPAVGAEDGEKPKEEPTKGKGSKGGKGGSASRAETAALNTLDKDKPAADPKPEKEKPADGEPAGE